MMKLYFWCRRCGEEWVEYYEEGFLTALAGVFFPSIYYPTHDCPRCHSDVQASEKYDG